MMSAFMLNSANKKQKPPHNITAILKIWEIFLEFIENGSRRHKNLSSSILKVGGNVIIPKLGN